MKKVVFVLFVVIFIIALAGCFGNQSFVYVGEKNGQSIFLDSNKGKVIYIDETNRFIDYVDLNPSSEAIAQVGRDKFDASITKNFDDKEVPGTNYTISLSTRFNSNHLYYIITVKPYNNNIRDFINTLSVEFLDFRGFLLEEIPSSQNWINIVNDSGSHFLQSSLL